MRPIVPADIRSSSVTPGILSYRLAMICTWGRCSRMRRSRSSLGDTQPLWLRAAFRVWLDPNHAAPCGVQHPTVVPRNGVLKTSVEAENLQALLQDLKLRQNQLEVGAVGRRKGNQIRRLRRLC